MKQPGVEKKPTNSVQTLGRALDILEELANHPRGIGLVELSSRIGLHKSTVFRMVSMLRERGYVQKDPSGLYLLGLGLVELTNSFLNSLDLKVEARPAMYELTETTRQTVFLAVRDGGEVVYIDKTETFTSLRRFSIIGTRVPVHCTSLGKALLLSLPSDELDELLDNYDFRMPTPNSIGSKEELAADLEEARTRGYTVDNEEHQIGVRCIGAPVKDFGGRGIAAISVSGHASVVTPDRFAEIGPLVVGTARKISRSMGYTGA